MNRIDRMIDTASHLDAAARMHRESAQSRPAVGQTGNFLDAVAQQAAGVTGLSAAEEAAQTQPVSLESMLRAKYPGLVYHVFDAGSSYWRSRNDYPHYLLYQEDLDTEALENWRPSGPNPAYEESSAIRKLGSIPAGKTAVVIHPAVQERMEREPEYAKEILSRIDAIFCAMKPSCRASPPVLPGASPSERTAASQTCRRSAIRGSPAPEAARTTKNRISGSCASVGTSILWSCGRKNRLRTACWLHNRPPLWERRRPQSCSLPN